MNNPTGRPRLPPNVRLEASDGDSLNLTNEEYQAERQKDGGFSESEKLYFDRVISYCKSAEDADRFCSSWRK
jgi:hypothetical protein